MRNGRFVNRLWRVVGGGLLLLAVLVGQSILTSRHQHEEQAVVETYSVARVLESDIGGLVGRICLALHTVALERERGLASGRSDPDTERAYIANIQANLPDVLGIHLFDAAGRRIFEPDFATEPAPGIGQRPWFARLRDGYPSNILISGPHREAAEGPGVIEFARRIEYADGRFAGAVVAPLPLDTVVGMLAAADIGSNGAVALRGEDLALVARHPPVPEGAAHGAVPGAVRELVAQGEISGTFRAISPMDGVERLFSYRKVTGFPLHVTVGRATDEYLGHWRRDMGLVAVLSAVLFGVTIAATLMVDRAWRHQRKVTRQLEMQAHTDPLTGLASRRRFFEMAEAELARSRRYDAPLSLLMLDIDRFKEVNDTYGHRAGDRVLQQLGRTCLQLLRNIDVVGRVGGEEFAILLPETDLEGAVDVAERLREAVERTEVARDDGVPLRATVSIGAAALEPAASLDTLLSRADAAMYDAKHLGRNRVRAHARES